MNNYSTGRSYSSLSHLPHYKRSPLEIVEWNLREEYYSFLFVSVHRFHIVVVYNQNGQTNSCVVHILRLARTAGKISLLNRAKSNCTGMPTAVPHRRVFGKVPVQWFRCFQCLWCGLWRSCHLNGYFLFVWIESGTARKSVGCHRLYLPSSRHRTATTSLWKRLCSENTGTYHL